MTQLRALLRVDLAYYRALLGGQLRSKNGGKKSVGRTALMTVLYLYVAVVFIGMFAAMFYGMAPTYVAGGLSWLYFTIAFMIGFAMMLIGSVFLAKAVLFEAKDNDLLLSMPIPPQKILIARLLPLYIMNLLYGGAVLATAVVCYYIGGGRLSVAGMLFLLVQFLALGLLSLAFSAIIGWLLAKLGRLFRNQAIPSLILTGVFLLLYMYFIQNGMQGLMTALFENGAQIAESFGAFPILYWLGVAVSDGAFLPFLGILFLCAAVYAIVHAVLTKTFLHTATTGGKSKKLRLRVADIRSASLSRTLLAREHARLMSSPIYLINACLGSLMMLIAAGALIWKRTEVLTLVTLLTAELGLSARAVGAVAALLVSWLSSMVMLTAPSVSLEGKTLWILRGLPLSGKDVLRAKLQLHLLWVWVPSWFLSAAAIFCLKLHDIAAILLLLIAPTVFASFSAVLGLYLSLSFANFHWTNEAQPVKQSVSVLLAMFIPMLLVFVPILLIILLEWEIFLVSAVWAAVMLLLLVIGYRILMTWGTKKFESFDA